VADETGAAAEIGRLVTNRRGDAVRTPEPRGLTIAIGTAAHGLTLDAETRLAKAAILYADHIILFNPTAAMLASAQHLGSLDDDQMIGFLRLMAPAHG
jgi:hypothetical protein